MSDYQMILTPVIMVSPNSDAIYAPSRLDQPRSVGNDEFVNKLADHSRAIKVSFEKDGISNPQTVTAYGDGMNGWYI